tara:strand:+ start:64 stop:1281 length:1218 start_codon:yes stop_codon:yes gene_type:complete
MSWNPMKIDTTLLPPAFLIRQPSQGERERRAWKYNPNPNYRAADQSQHYSWFNTITGEEQVNEPKTLTREEIEYLKSHHTFMDIERVDSSDPDSDPDSYSDSDSDSDLDIITSAINTSQTKDNRTGARCSVDCAVRSMKGMGWLNEEHKADLIEFANKNNGIDDVDLNDFYKKKKYKHRIKLTKIKSTLGIYHYADKNMKPDTCSAFMIYLESKNRVEINNKIISKMHVNYEKYNDGIMTKDDYEAQNTILDNKLIKHGSHVVIICKDSNGKITLWDTQRSDEDKNYIQNVGEDSINDYINVMGLVSNDFALLEKVEGIGVIFDNLNINTSSRARNGKTKRKAKGKPKGKKEQKTNKQKEQKTKKQKEQKTKKRSEQSQKRRKQYQKRRKQTRADIFTRKRNKKS